MIDTGAALAFLAQSRSPFLRLAGEWLDRFDDPGELLVVLSGDVGQHLGPWDTFRHCALLGLFHSAAVRALGLDVLSEPLDAGGHPPPIAPALALAWARDRWPEEPAPHAARYLQALGERADGQIPDALVAAAELALAHPAGAAPDDGVFHAALARCGAALEGETAAALAVPIWEAAVLAGSPQGLDALAARAAAAGQEADGGLRGLDPHPILRGFVTLRAVGLVKRQMAELGAGPGSAG